MVRALSQFISIFGIPKTIQTDQGTNFTSHLFAQVLKQLNIKQKTSSAYHAQSQGALERFHQTLKSLLRSYCVQMERDWEEGLPWLMLGAREVTQESTGFSCNELVFGHTVRGPLNLLYDQWKDAEPPKNLIDYVNGFRQKLYAAGELARKNLACAQNKMKQLYDRGAERRDFHVGDQVLALLPVVTSPFQAKYVGPYKIKEKISDHNYIIATPERRKSTQLCHVNLLKPFYERTPAAVTSDQGAPEPARAGCAVGKVSTIHTPQTVSTVVEDGLPAVDSAVLQGRLKNSEFMHKLPVLFNHLSESKQADLFKLIKSFPCLFGDIPTQSHWLDIRHIKGSDNVVADTLFRAPQNHGE